MSHYVVMWNLPGCLPEMEPYHTLSYTKACDYLIEEIDFDESISDVEASDAITCIRDQKPGTSFNLTFSNTDYIYSISLCDSDDSECIDVESSNV